MAKYIVINGIKVARDFTPETFGRLTTIGPRFVLRSRTGKTQAYQVCQCACGNVVVVRRTHLNTSLIQSCKCLQKDARRECKLIHGMAESSEYSVWSNMKTRCNNTNRENSRNYTERGIRVCGRWMEPNGQGFLNFLEDMGPRPGPEYTIERKDVNGNYCPENCIWVTIDIQARNKRTNVNLTAFGKTQCRKDWAVEYGICESTLRWRIAAGWDLEKALTTPPRGRSSR